MFLVGVGLNRHTLASRTSAMTATRQKRHLRYIPAASCRATAPQLPYKSARRQRRSAIITAAQIDLNNRGVELLRMRCGRCAVTPSAASTQTPRTRQLLHDTRHKYSPHHECLCLENICFEKCLVVNITQIYDSIPLLHSNLCIEKV